MKTIKMEINLYDFQAWQGGKDTLDNIITEGKVEEFEALLNACFEELTDTQLNDLLWFDTEWIYEQLDMYEYLD